MNGHSLVAVYESRAHAERARDRLMQLGIPATDIRLSADSGTERVESEHRGGFWDWLFGEDIPERDRSWYDTNLRGGRTAVSVLVRDEAEHGRVAEVLEEFDPIAFDQFLGSPDGGDRRSWADGNNGGQQHGRSGCSGPGYAPSTSARGCDPSRRR